MFDDYTTTCYMVSILEENKLPLPTITFGSLEPVVVHTNHFYPLHFMGFATTLVATTQALTDMRPFTHATMKEKEERWIIARRRMWTPKHAV